MRKVTLSLNFALRKVFVIFNVVYGRPEGFLPHTKCFLVSGPEQVEVCTVSQTKACAWFLRWLFRVAITQVAVGATIFVGRVGCSPITDQKCVRSTKPIKILAFSLAYFRSNVFYRRKETLGWVVSCETLCEMHVEQLLLILSLPSAEHTSSFCLG